MQTSIKEDKTMNELNNRNERMYSPDTVYSGRYFDRRSSVLNESDTKAYERYTSDMNSYERNPQNNIQNNSAPRNNNTHNNKNATRHPFRKAVALGLVFGVVAGTTIGGINFGISRINDKFFTKQETVKEVSDSSGSIDTVSVNPSNTSDSSISDVSDIAAKVQPSIVSINTKMTTTYQYFFETYQQESSGAGSGIIVGKTDDALYVATNYHVIEGATEISV